MGYLKIHTVVNVRSWHQLLKISNTCSIASDSGWNYDCMDAALDTLQDARFRICESEGFLSNKIFSHKSTPHVHLHITNSERRGLWDLQIWCWLPNPSNTDEGSILLACDPDRPPESDTQGTRGRFQKNLHPVCVLFNLYLVQFLLSLTERGRNSSAVHEMNHISYTLEFCAQRGVLKNPRLARCRKNYVYALFGRLLNI